MSRRNLQFSTVRTEGGLLPQDVLSRIQAGDKDLPGLTPESYHLGPHERIGEAVNRAWSRLTAAWRALQEALAKEPDAAKATGLTRDRWLLPLFQELGYGRLPKGQAIEVEGKSYAVSHMSPWAPVHLLGVGVDLDRRQAGVSGAAKASPHGLVQEFLNRSEKYLWGFVSNGLHLRVLRDHHSLTRQAYVEFDLEAIMEGEQYSEFLLLWMICHQSRVEAEKPEDCWLERWFNTSRDEGIRALDKLRGGVERAIESFGTGFLAHRSNTKLREALESGELDKQDYYRQVLRLVYRLIFLFVAEERDALLDPQADEAAKNRYLRFYATRRLRELSDKRRGGPHGDLWQGLRFVMSKVDVGCPELALPALGSRLWGPTACPWLMDAECGNDHLLDAVRHISNIEEGRTRYPVNWRNVGADELGSIYEGLLELHPRINKEAAEFVLETAAGHERKTTGSYYTPTELVDCLLDSALDPVLEEARKNSNPEAAILDLKVCDPACGSGHFLVAAARRIAKRLAAIRAGEDEPSPREVQRALRDVVGRCIYGVDVNAMAVELCKVSLWMEAIEPGRPLSFLDSHIQRGNALLGTTPALMARGIPDDAFKPIEGDDKDFTKKLKARNRKARKSNQLSLAFPPPLDTTVVDQFLACDESPDPDLAAVREHESCWLNLQRSNTYRDARFRADAWCAAFVWPKQDDEVGKAAITEDVWRRLQKDASIAGAAAKKTVRELARQHRFFHWHLAFPQVFGEAKEQFEDDDTNGWTGGFDVVLGNPPWERVTLKEKEWFATRDPAIAGARTGAQRLKLIAALEHLNPALFDEFKREKREAAGMKEFLRTSGSYPKCGCGDVNTFAVFAELGRRLSRGRSGMVLPTGIVTADTTQEFVADLVEHGQLVSLFDFDNRAGIFPAVQGNVRFCLLTASSGYVPEIAAAAQLRATTEMSDPERTWRLTPEDIKRINPNTRTMPLFPTRRDAAIAQDVYRKHRCVDEEGAEYPGKWTIPMQRMLHMGDDSHLFRTADQLAANGYRRVGPSWLKSADEFMPLLEAKLCYQYDHRAGTFDGIPEDARYGTHPATRDVTEAEHRDPCLSGEPRYWVPRSEVRKRVGDREYLLGFRDAVSAVADSRSLVAGVVPAHGAGDTLKFLFPTTPTDLVFVGAWFNAFATDFVFRLKAGGAHASFFLLRQLPIPSRERAHEGCKWDGETTGCGWLMPRVLELTYTAWDLQSFARDLGYVGPPFQWNTERRFLLRAEVDAAFFHLYGIERDGVDYIMETFPIVRRNDEKAHGEYWTKRVILEVYDAMQRAADTGERYQTLLDPPPADRRVVHPERTRPAWAPAIGPRPIDVPPMPQVIPTVDPSHEPAFVVWAMVHAAGGVIPRLELARAFSLRRDPTLLSRLAPGELAAVVGNWTSRVGNRGDQGTLAAALRALADRQGIQLTTDGEGRSVVSLSPHTPPEGQLDEWFRFEARLALRVLEALPAQAMQQVDSSLRDADRAFLQAEGA